MFYYEDGIFCSLYNNILYLFQTINMIEKKKDNNNEKNIINII